MENKIILHKISAICPIKNEEKFLPIHLRNLINKVDEIIYCDTGCSDNSVPIIKEWQKKYGDDKIKLISWKVENPYQWEEGKIRQHLVNQAKNNFILIADADEVLSDNFNEEISRHDISGKLIQFKFLPFWKNLKTIRCNTYGDSHWHPNNIMRIFDKRDYRYEESGNHSFLKISDYSKIINIEAVKLFHLHYALFDRCKPNDNRLGDLGLLDYWRTGRLPDKITDEMLDYHKINKSKDLNTMEYSGEYPDCIRDFVK